MKAQDLIGKWLRYRGERGQVVSIRGGDAPSVTFAVSGKPSFVVPRERGPRAG